MPQPDDGPDARLEYYKEQLTHGRHTEVQRSSVATLAAAFCGAIIGKLLDPPLDRTKLPYSIALFLVGLVSLIITAKLYERFRLHNEVARLVRDDIDKNLGKFRRDAEVIIKKKYPFLFWLHLHIIWNSLLGLFAAIGLVTAILILKRQ